MADTALYTYLKSKNKDIADKYFAITSDDLTHVLDEKEITDILTVSFSDSKIEAAEVDCYAAMFIGKNIGNGFTGLGMTADGQSLLGAALGSTDLLHAMVKGAAHFLTTADELKEVNQALDLAAKVNFSCPKTGITYDATAFNAIKQLVADKEIMIAQIADDGLVWDKGNIGALYDRTALKPFLMLFEKPTSRVALIAHEMTHAVQDWSDVNTLYKYTELDGLLTEALVALALKPGAKIPKNHPYLMLEKFITKKQARASDKDYVAAYEKAADSLLSDPVYGARNAVNPNADMTGEKANQKSKLDEVIKGLSAKPAKAKTPKKK